MNGLIWIRASTVSHIIAFGKVIQEADKMRYQVDSSTTNRDDKMEVDEEIEQQKGGIDRKMGEELVRKRGALDSKVVKAIVSPYL